MDSKWAWFAFLESIFAENGFAAGHRTYDGKFYNQENLNYLFFLGNGSVGFDNGNWRIRPVLLGDDLWCLDF